MTSNLEVTIAGRRVGARSPVYFIAEAGSNHDGSFDQAKRLIDVAVEAGADAVKFQAFTAANLYPKNAGRSEYLGDDRSIYEIIRSLEMPIAWIAPLADYCRERGIHFLCTPFDEKSADALAAYVPAFKLASYDMTNYPLLQHVARKGKPMIVSTGTARLEEVKDMIGAVRAVGDVGLVVLQCTAKYPAPLSALNVRTVATMAELGVLTGLSDHSREPLPGPMAAVALGAVVIEKHFTLSNQLAGPDHAYALEPHDLKDLIAKLRQVEAALGSGEKIVQPEEQELRAFARRSIFTTRPLSAGARLRRSDLALLRCGALPYGLHPKEFVTVLGRPVARPLAAETAPMHDDLGPLRLVDGDVSLRLAERRDAFLLFAWRSHDADVPPFFALTRNVGPAERWYDECALRADLLQLVVERSTRPIGVVALGDIDFGYDRAGFGVLAPATTGRDAAVAQRACALVISHAFATLELTTLSQIVSSDDTWTLELARRLGFEGATEPPKSVAGHDRRPVELTLTSKRWARQDNALVMSRQGPPAVEVRDATIDDARYVWTINNHPTVRAQSIRQGDIPWENHARWFEKQLSRTDGRLVVGLEGLMRIGVARFDVAQDEATISIAIGLEHRGRGVGTRLVERVTTAAFERTEVRRAVAFTRPDNPVSQRAFLANGYRLVGETSEGEVTLLRFEKNRG